MKKAWLRNLTLTIVSITLTLVFAEYLFRMMVFNQSSLFNRLKDPGAYSNHTRHPNEDFFNENYWKLQTMFNTPEKVIDPHPLLGWTGYFERESYEHHQKGKVDKRRPVLLFGNSFSMCVDSVKCFEDIMNNDSAFSDKYRLFNYGVGGYGVGQIGLLVDKAVPNFNSPFVILGILTTDLDRSLLKFRQWAKPYFRLEGGNLVLRGVPVIHNSIEYVDLHPPEINSYLWNRFKSSFLYPCDPDEGRKERRMNRIRSLNEAILKKTFEFLRNREIDFTVLIFQPAYHSQDDFRLQFLYEVCKKYNVPMVREPEIRQSDVERLGFGANRYTIPGDGHPTTYLNRLVSKGIMDKIYTLDSGKELYSMVGRIQYYIEEIRSTPEWLSSIQKESRKTGQHLDTLIRSHASYMVYMENHPEN